MIKRLGKLSRFFFDLRSFSEGGLTSYGELHTELVIPSLSYRACRGMSSFICRVLVLNSCTEFIDVHRCTSRHVVLIELVVIVEISLSRNSKAHISPIILHSFSQLSTVILIPSQSHSLLFPIFHLPILVFSSSQLIFLPLHPKCI